MFDKLFFSFGLVEQWKERKGSERVLLLVGFAIYLVRPTLILLYLCFILGLLLERRAK
jgi:hypothetical protein